MRARVLGSLQTVHRPQITWVTVIPEASSSQGESVARRHLLKLAQDNVYGDPTLVVLRSDNPVSALSSLASDHDLLVLGMHRSIDGKRVFGEFNITLLRQTEVATLLIGGR
jgi:hypothetical protein